MLVRDVYSNAPIPVDAQFIGIGVEDADNLFQFYFASEMGGNQVHCINIRPQLMLDIIKGECGNKLPSDTELIGISVHEAFTFLRLDVKSNKFEPSDSGQMPLIQVRYEGGTFMVLDQSHPDLPSTEHRKIVEAVN
jgi:hypothetical protein